MRIKGNFDKIINEERPVLIDFYAEWCGPCKMMAPILKELAFKAGDKARIIKIDVDKNPDIASRYQVMSVPTLMLFRKGEVKWRESGIVQSSELLKIIEEHRA